MKKYFNMYALSGLGYTNKVILCSGLPVLLPPFTVTCPLVRQNCVGLASPLVPSSCFLLKLRYSVLDIFVIVTSVVLLSPSKFAVAPAVVVIAASTMSTNFLFTD